MTWPFFNDETLFSYQQNVKLKKLGKSNFKFKFKLQLHVPDNRSTSHLKDKHVFTTRYRSH